MRVALLGYGKMGKAIDALAHAQGIEVVARLTSGWTPTDLQEADVCIDFSTPTAAPQNIDKVLELGKPLVVGTTGWTLPDLPSRVQHSGLIFSPNFAIGVALFAHLAKEAGELLTTYDRAGIEYHHRSKVDRPSGTAKRLSKLVPDLSFESVRCGHESGTHTLVFDGQDDTITLTYRSRGRTAYASGALTAARWIQDKTGYFTMEDLLCTL